MERSYYTRIAVLEQVGYREWTESLGSDREWVIQGIQSSLYHGVQRVASELGGFVLPLRYDYMMILGSGLDPGEHELILGVAEKHSPVPVRMASACAYTPLGAEAAASRRLRGIEPGSLGYTRCPRREAVAVAHIDVNDFTAITMSTSVYRTFWLVRRLLLRLHASLARHGGLVSYLGGDNVVAVLPVNDAGKAVQEILDDGLKAGLGISGKAREALRLAAEALDTIRKSRRKEKRTLVLGGLG